MEAFLENLLMVLPAVRVDTFIQRSRSATAAQPPSPSQPAAVRFVIDAQKHGLQAFAVVAGGEFIIEAGSTARLEWEGREVTPSGYASLHAQLKRAGVLVAEQGRCVFTQNYAFTAPSAAAAVVYGRSTNGAEAWRVEATGQTYKDWEADQLAAPQGTS